MTPTYFDTFLAFLGLTFGMVSALPDLFFQKTEASPAVRTGSSGAASRKR